MPALVKRRLITSGESLARCLPQLTASLRAAGLTDPRLRQLDVALYQAFRRRRSLLLLNLEKQVQIDELPWAAAIDLFRNNQLPGRELARQTLEELAALTLTSFPYPILPNKLLQELRALAKTAELNIPLVDELAADIFRGQFSRKFVEAARQAADLLNGSLYARYYEIDYAAILKLPLADEKPVWRWPWAAEAGPDFFAQICADRAGVALGGYQPAVNGMIIEQQQILTTHNLAGLFAALGLSQTLRGQLDGLARQCFQWICQRQQMKTDRWHARLIMLKNTAHAWRQMIFYLACLPASEVSDFLRWAEAHLAAQPETFRKRFRPAVRGLALAVASRPAESEPAARRFTGWSAGQHWLLTDVSDNPAG